jgi:hypothetical protein
MNVDGVKKTAQALCLDPNGDHSPPEIIDPLFVQAFQALLMELDDTDFAFNEETVEIPGIAAGTRDLRDQGAAGKPLERMVDVRDVDWKLAGEPETSYRTVRPLDRKLDVDSVDYLRSWEVTAGVLFLSPVNVAIDLRAALRDGTDNAGLGRHEGSGENLRHPRLRAGVAAFGTAQSAPLREVRGESGRPAGKFGSELHQVESGQGAALG